MQKGLKIVNRTDTVLFDAAWTAGVDYNEEEIGEIEKVGLEIAEEIQDRSDRLGRRRKYDDNG